jgi:hypothetical protein
MSNKNIILLQEIHAKADLKALMHTKRFSFNNGERHIELKTGCIHHFKNEAIANREPNVFCHTFYERCRYHIFIKTGMSSIHKNMSFKEILPDWNYWKRERGGRFNANVAP